jgi:hypothetical protein
VLFSAGCKEVRFGRGRWRGRNRSTQEGGSGGEWVIYFLLTFVSYFFFVGIVFCWVNVGFMAEERKLSGFSHREIRRENK